VAQDRNGLDTRDKILEVAEHLFAVEGYSGAHLQGIAEQVGVQKTALYYYFPSKAALYGTVLARILDAFDRTVRQALESQGSHADRLVRLLEDLNDLLAEHANYAYILIRLFVDPVRIEDDSLGATVRQVVERILLFYREGVDRGAFAKRSSRHLFQSVLGASVFHYATSGFGAAVRGVDDIFTRGAVAWRREEVRELFLRGVLLDGDDESRG